MNNKKDFFSKINIQQAPKPTPAIWYVRHADATSTPIYTIEGYEFTLDKRSDSIGQIEGFSPSLNFRCAFLPEVGHYWVSCDFAGQELRIMANLSNEKTWINAFLNNEDPHKATAVAIWGADKYNKEKRKVAKTINFGLLYGMSAEKLAATVKVSIKEAEEYIAIFFEKLPDVERFLNHCALVAQENKEITNFYGRKRRMANFIKYDGRISNAGKRRAYNHPVQSVGADIIKLALIKLHDKLYTVEPFINNAFFMNTVHDEINSSIRYDLVKPFIKRKRELMEHTMQGCPVKIVTELEIGHSWGLTWKFIQDPETLELVPAYKPIEEEVELEHTPEFEDEDTEAEDEPAVE